MRPMIEPAAGRLFDIYYQYTSKEDLTALQSLTEEAYKVHERLRKLSPNNKGFFELDEFILLKALRNHSVHGDEFLGKSYGINQLFVQKQRMDLCRVCLIEKETVHQAINAEPQLEHGEIEKVSRMRNQLVPLGEFYNIEPVIFNFMVKVYEILMNLKLSIPGEGFSDISEAYKNEIYHNYPHYVPLRYPEVDSKELLDNLTPLEEFSNKENKGLETEKNDPFNSVSFLDVDYSQCKVGEFGGAFYEKMRDTVFNKILKDEELTNLSITLPKNLGWGFVDSNETIPPLTIKRFNIGKQREEFEKHKIKLDSYFYETTAYELLVLFTHKGTVYPVVICKDELIKRQSANKQASYEQDIIKRSIAKFGNTTARSSTPVGRNLGRNDPCHCGSGNKYKKCCLH